MSVSNIQTRRVEMGGADVLSEEDLRRRERRARKKAEKAGDFVTVEKKKRGKKRTKKPQSEKGVPVIKARSKKQGSGESKHADKSPPVIACISAFPPSTRIFELHAEQELLEEKREATMRAHYPDLSAKTREKREHVGSDTVWVAAASSVPKESELTIDTRTKTEVKPLRGTTTITIPAVIMAKKSRSRNPRAMKVQANNHEEKKAAPVRWDGPVTGKVIANAHNTGLPMPRVSQWNCQSDSEYDSYDSESEYEPLQYYEDEERWDSGWRDDEDEVEFRR